MTQLAALLVVTIYLAGASPVSFSGEAFHAQARHDAAYLTFYRAVLADPQGSAAAAGLARARAPLEAGPPVELVAPATLAAGLQGAGLDATALRAAALAHATASPPNFGAALPLFRAAAVLPGRRSWAALEHTTWP
jgi:hypothetical protein